MSQFVGRCKLNTVDFFLNHDTILLYYNKIKIFNDFLNMFMLFI